MKAVGEPSARIGVCSAPSDTEALIALFEAIASAEGWQPGEQLRTYRDASVYFGVWAGSELAGGMQVVLPDAAGRFPFQQVWPEVNVDDACHALHVAVLAIRPEHRGQQRLFWPLLVALWRFCVAQGVQRIVIEATPEMLARYRRLGFALEVIGDLRPHWGEDCCLCRADAVSVAGAMLTRAVRSPAFRAIVCEAMRPLTQDYAIPDRDCRAAAAVPS